MGGVILSLFFGVLFGCKLSWPICFSVDKSSQFILRNFGKISFSLTLITLIGGWVYTGGTYKDILTLAFEPRLAYEKMLKFNVEKNSYFYFYKTVSMLFSPLYYAIIPFMILRWGSLSKKQVIFGLCFLLSMITFSILRGTDREIGELVILILGASMIKIAMKIEIKQLSLNSVVKYFFSSTIFILLFFIIFSFRKYERLNGLVNFCIYDVACVNQNSLLSYFLPEKLYFSVAMLASYLSQGYYGLYLTLKMNSCFTYLVGHSPFLSSVIEKIFNINLYQCSFMGQLDQYGWSDSYTWSTIYPWLASDITYYMVIPFLFFISIFFAFSWKVAVGKQLFSSSMAFIFLFYAIIFSVANNQLALAPETYLAFLVWILIFIKDIKWMQRK